MSVAKVIEIIAESSKGWEDAAQNALKEVSETVRDVKHLYVENMQAIVEDGEIVKYRLNCKVTFVVRT